MRSRHELCFRRTSSRLLNWPNTERITLVAYCERLLACSTARITSSQNIFRRPIRVFPDERFPDHPKGNVGQDA